jgi:aromatic-L-amino-acid decarboxylase
MTDSLSNSRESLDPSPDVMRALGYELVDQVVNYLSTQRDQPVARRGTHNDFSLIVDEPLPECGQDPAESMEFFFRRILPDMTAVNHPRFHAYIPGPSSYVGALGAMLAAGTNPFVGTWLGGATVSALELTVIRWIAEMLDYDPAAAGVFTSGGSMANLTALAAARSRLPHDARSTAIYVSSEGHASVTRAAAVLGFSDDAIRIVAVDESFRMDVDVLEAMIRDDAEDGRTPLCVVANAGTTNLGVIDPLPQLVELCRQHGIWLHIDAAYGGFAALTPSGKSLLAGMQDADSLTLDPHKWLYCPIGIGCVLVRDQWALKTAFATSGDYLKDVPTDEVNFFEYGPELSRPARVLPVWMVIRSAGREQLAHQIGEDMRLARLAADLLADDERLEVIPPTLSVVGFRHRRRPDESEQDRSARDTRLMEETLASGELMLSTTLINGQNTLRFVVMNHRTTEADIYYSVSRIRLYAV